ncbi:hypothetical protein BG004_008484 [Podila humilis]|nr:hypothetical protein BG004_008484 [Podila humilis]
MEGNGYTILPVLATASWSVAQMDGLFSTLEKEQDPRLQAASVTKITLALIAADSTLTYVDMTRS